MSARPGTGTGRTNPLRDRQLGNPLGTMFAMMLGYTAGAAPLWGAGMVDLMDWVGLWGGMWPAPLVGYLVPLALAWTMVITAYLGWAFLTRRDEDRPVRELASAYRDPAA